jgi:8-oxo-dGTP pyrophosphatase MutT (NUDIX family)
MKNTCLILIKVDNKFLLFKRSLDGELFQGQFGLAGGGREEGESNLECLKRECIEEINVIPENIGFLKSYQFGGRQLNIFYGELTDLDKIELNHEHTEFKLFSPEELFNKGVIKTNVVFVKDYFEKFTD